MLVMTFAITGVSAALGDASNISGMAELSNYTSATIEDTPAAKKRRTNESRRLLPKAQGLLARKEPHNENEDLLSWGIRHPSNSSNNLE